MSIIKFAYTYLRERQSPLVLSLHLIILCLVIFQTIVSNLMRVGDNGEVSRNIIEYFGTYVHIGTGLFLFMIAFPFFYLELTRHGSAYFFPYAFGNFTQLKKDFDKLKRFELPEADAYGIAAVVQGLGMIALALVILSGIAWFLSWIYQAQWANSLKEFHKLLTGLIQAYLVGHGGMGILHIYTVQRRHD